MKREFLKITFVVAIAMISGNNVLNVQKTEALFDSVLSNVEALAVSEEEHLYNEKNENTIEIWNKETGTFKKITVIECEGEGCLSC